MIVVADDLTGACDTAAQFADKNCQTAVFLPGQISERRDKTWDVLSFCTDSRNLTGDEAYESVAALLRALPIDKNLQIYKKVDSLLRGNTAHEINALLDVTDIKTAIVAPTFPAQHRTMIHGLIKTPRETVNAVKRFSNIACPVEVIPLETVRQGSKVLAAKIISISQEQKKIYLVDAADEEDLLAIAQVPLLLSKKAVLCGSAGLAAHLSVSLRCSANREKSNNNWQAVANPLPVLTVAGSTRVETARQINALSNYYGVSIAVIDPALLCGETRKAEISRCHHALTEQLQSGNSVLLFATSGLFSKTDYFTLADKKKNEGETAVAKAMAEVVSTLLRQHKIGALVLTGGDTALKTCYTLGANAIHIKGQLLPGIAAGRLVGGFVDGLAVVTKSGAFGEKETLIQAIQGIAKFFALE